MALLSDVKVKAATIPNGKTQKKLSDSGGLYLLMKKSGKYWRLDYRFGDKRKTMALGVYPQVSLKEARDKRESAKKLLEKNIDPCQRKQSYRRKAIAKSNEDTFKGIATEWMAKKTTQWVKTTIVNTQSKLNRHIFPWIGTLPITEIEAPDVLALVQRAEKR